MTQEIEVKSLLSIALTCSRTVGYFNVQNDVNTIKRLYVRNGSEEDVADARIRISSSPAFLIPTETELSVLPRKSTTKFEPDVKISPIFMVALNNRVEAEVMVDLLCGDTVVQSAKAQVSLTPFNECDYSANAESIAGFVRRTAEVNKLIGLTFKKLESWSVDYTRSAGYRGGRNSVRNFFAAAFAVLTDQRFIKTDAEDGCENITDFSELLITKAATPLELSLLYAAVVEANGLNPVIARIAGKWYVGCFLINECFNDMVGDDVSLLRKRVERGVNDMSVVCADELFNGVAFERAEKSAAQTLKKTEDSEFFVDIMRARIMHIYPLPERVRKEGGYDVVQSKEFATSLAPEQIREYKGDIGGEKEINRVTQWERKLLDMDMRNALLNFKISQSAVKLLVPNLEDFVKSIGENKSYLLDSRPKDGEEAISKITDGFERASFLKPFVDYILYEYKNKRLRTVFDAKTHESTLTKLFRKERSAQEETGTATLYIAVGFLKWCESDGADDKYAPLFLYPATLSRKGAANTSYTLEVNSEEARVNSTLLEYLYQSFNLDMRGLADVELNGSDDVLSVLSRIRRETVDFKKWEVMNNVYLASLSFSNYLLWSDVRYKSDRFREHPVIRSLINNRLELDGDAFNLSDKSSDEAYSGNADAMYLPISADSSQYSAIYDSLSKSFVLHGPPGTGKSQTITNIIANNIVRGRRVLFVAEKMAALSVVHKRLQAIGLGDFCLELHSTKTNKNQILNQIIHTLALAEGKDAEEHLQKAEDIRALIVKLQNELDALHKTRYLGFSLYDAILNYFENQDAPDCLRIDSLFYEKLTQTSFNNYLDVLTELSLRAKECGDVEKSPFKHIGRFEYTEEWRASADAALEVCLLELKHFRQYARCLMPLFNMRTVSLTEAKTDALYNISKGLKSKYIAKYFKNCKQHENSKGLVDSFREAMSKNEVLMREYSAKYGVYPSDLPLDELKDALNRDSYPRAIKKIIPSSVDRVERATFIEYLIKCEENRLLTIRRAQELGALFELEVVSVPAVNECVKKISAIYDDAEKLYSEPNVRLFNECCITLTKGEPNTFLEFYEAAYDNARKASKAFKQLFNIDSSFDLDDVNTAIDYISNIQKNLDLIPSWCKYQAIVDKCRTNGFEFILEPLSMGEITADDILRCFKKCVYHNFIRSELYLDDVLCQFSGLTLEEAGSKFKALTEEYERLTRQELYERMLHSLPRADSPGEHNLERVMLMRAEKTNMKGTTLRKLFAQVPSILKATCPCMLMSPATVSQFLDIDMDKFDLVIFDEASQVPTCKAVGCIARGKNLIVVGDPKQLPPTSFFSSDFKDDEHYESEDLESILDDCLALGMPENHLLWHYRSNHESLIAFSNAMYYDNTLLTFPSPNELNSKVTFKYVDGVYERGGSKCNKKEADELIQEVIARLKDASTRSQSIGIVTFNTAQQNYIENGLSKLLHQYNLESAAYETDEPLFVKNLENVQGDERDVILFSIGYGPDANGKLSLNFGPINQSGGYKRLNVAVTRARNEMKVFSAITGNMIDLSRTNSKGVEGLKAFLEYAERGKDMLAFNSTDVGASDKGIGALIAEELKDRGILCEYNVGVSDFKIDVAVVDPRNKDKYILAILCDSENACKLKGVKDRVAMQTRILKKLGWNTYQLWSVNFFNNPKREIQKIKEAIAALTEKKIVSKKTLKDISNRYRKTYKSFYVKPMASAGADYVLNFVNEDKIVARIRDIIETESPIEERALLDKLLIAYNVPKNSKRAVAQLTEYMHTYATFMEEFDGKTFYKDKPVETYRPNDSKIVRDITKIHPYEIIAAVRCAAESKLNLTREDAVKEVITLFGNAKKTKPVAEWIDKAIDTALKENLLVMTVEGILST